MVLESSNVKAEPDSWLELYHSTQPHHLVFTFTPFNQKIVGAILSRPEYSNGKILLVNTAEPLFIENSMNTINFTARDHPPIERVRKYRALGRLIGKLRSGGLLLSVTAPHPHNLLSNDLLLKPAEGMETRLFEDGTANYCKSENVGKLKWSALAKHVLGSPLGLPYQCYRGHISGLDAACYTRGYFLKPSQVYRPERFGSLVEIEPRNLFGHATMSLKNRVVVLEQDIESVFNRQTSNKLRAKLFELVKRIDAQAFVKPHPSQSLPLIKSLYPDDFQLITSKEPAEQVIIELAPKWVVSFTSSALKNAKLSCPAARCISVGAREFDRLRQANITGFFEEVGVEVI